VPIAILGAIAAVLVLPHFPGRRAGRFDVLGFLTVATGLFTLLLAPFPAGLVLLPQALVIAVLMPSPDGSMSASARGGRPSSAC
jgi:hypothetical protein